MARDPVRADPGGLPATGGGRPKSVRGVVAAAEPFHRAAGHFRDCREAPPAGPAPRVGWAVLAIVRVRRGGVHHALAQRRAVARHPPQRRVEAELVAAVKMSTELIGICQLFHDWGLEEGARLLVDSSAAIGVINRKGNGRLRHVKVGMMWIQEKVEEGEIRIEKVLGTENPADLMTKYPPAAKIQQYMEKLGQESRGGRAEKSLKTEVAG